MKNMRLFSIILTISILFTVCFHITTPLASAFSDKKGSISLSTINSQDKSPIENVALRLYRVADAKRIENSITYTYTDEFKKCNMSLGNLQDAYLPVHLSVFADENSLTYTEIKSDKNGKIVFDNLSTGAYLIVSSTDTNEGLMISPFIVSVPIYDNVKDIWLFDINATPKININKPTDKDEVTYITVKKVWNNTKKNPESIKVSLLCDFKEVETIILNENNNWSYRWDKLSKNCSWCVVEKEVPDGYEVFYDTSTNTVIITNTKTSDEESPSEPTTLTDEESPSEPATPPEEETTISDELIHTGQLNWPIPILAVAGLLFFSIGWAILNFGKKENV